MLAFIAGFVLRDQDDGGDEDEAGRAPISTPSKGRAGPTGWGTTAGRKTGKLCPHPCCFSSDNGGIRDDCVVSFLLFFLFLLLASVASLLLSLLLRSKAMRFVNKTVVIDSTFWKNPAWEHAKQKFMKHFSIVNLGRCT